MFINNIVAEKWDNALSMAVHSLHPTLSGHTAQNFVSGKSPKSAQALDIVCAIEGFESNVWATPKQVESLGGTVDEYATIVPIYWSRTSRKSGKQYFEGYYLVNVEQCTLPELPEDAYNTAMAAFDAAESETYTIVELDAPKPLPVSAKKAAAIKKAREDAVKNVDRKKIRENLKLSKHDELDTTPQKRGAMTKRNNCGDARTRNIYADGKPVPTFKLDLDEFGIHVEANTMADAQTMLEMAVDAYLKLRK